MRGVKVVSTLLEILVGDKGGGGPPDAGREVSTLLEILGRWRRLSRQVLCL